MILKERLGRKKVFVVVSILVCVLISIITITAGQFETFTQIFQSIPSLDWPEDFETPNNGRVLVPMGYNIPKSKLKSHLKGTSAETWKISQLKDIQILPSPPRMDTTFTEANSTLFSMSNYDSCEKRGQQMDFKVDKSHNLSYDLEYILKVFKEEAEFYGDTYNQHLWPVFENRTFGEHLDSDWYRFSGSSVWLKDYNIHFVISRLAYSKLRLRNQPRISMILAQVYDENWKELKDVRLVFPTNDINGASAFTANGQHFTSQRFPRMLPIPFDIGKEHKYWGAEDPRVLLVRNKKGYDEPVMIFNAFHVLPGTDRSVHEVPGIRTMFMSFPFQFQQGKSVEVPDGEQTQDDWFTRTKSIKIKGDPPAKLEKNWIPFVSNNGSHSENLMMATQLEPLRVIKCDLWSGIEECEAFESFHGNVGPLRGGTPLLSVKKIDQLDKEFFVGYARAHLSSCGCGMAFYRPNLVVVTRTKNIWKLTHVASFTDLGIEVFPWAPGQNVCEHINAMIPNGIEHWDIGKDVLSLFISVSDATVERVHVKGILGVLEQSNVWDFGKNDDMKSPVNCALDVSKQFCEAYGEKHNQLKQIQGD